MFILIRTLINTGQNEYLLVWHWKLIHRCPHGHSLSCNRNHCNLNVEARMAYWKLECICILPIIFVYCIYYSEITKVRIFSSNVNSVHYYECETRKLTAGLQHKIQWPFSQKFLRSIMLVRENLRFCSFSQKFLREYLRVKSVVTLRQF